MKKLMQFAGNLTLEDMMTALPFQDKLFQCRLFGKEIKQVLEWSVADFKPTDRYLHHFLLFSGNYEGDAQ